MYKMFTSLATYLGFSAPTYPDPIAQAWAMFEQQLKDRNFRSYEIIPRILNRSLDHWRGEFIFIDHSYDYHDAIDFDIKLDPRNSHSVFLEIVTLYNNNYSITLDDAAHRYLLIDYLATDQPWPCHNRKDYGFHQRF